MPKAVKLYRAEEGDVLVTLVDFTNTLKTLKKERKLSPLQCEKFFEVLSFALYLASFFKEEGDRLLCKVQGEGCEIFADATKNFISGHIEGENFEGKGLLSLTRIAGGIPLNSASEMESMDLKEEFLRFFRMSEQRELSLNFLDGDEALFLEALPGASEGSVSKVAQKIKEDGRAAIDNFHAVTEREFLFRCRCSKARARAAVLSLGKEDALALLKEKGKIEVCCPDCGKRYPFLQEDIFKLFKINGR